METLSDFKNVTFYLYPAAAAEAGNGTQSEAGNGAQSEAGNGAQRKVIHQINLIRKVIHKVNLINHNTHKGGHS